jgi:hypothetical protein
VNRLVILEFRDFVLSALNFELCTSCLAHNSSMIVHKDPRTKLKVQSTKYKAQSTKLQ